VDAKIGVFAADKGLSQESVYKLSEPPTQAAGSVQQDPPQALFPSWKPTIPDGIPEDSAALSVTPIVIGIQSALPVAVWHLAD
jgi:hypothetical protein